MLMSIFHFFCDVLMPLGKDFEIHVWSSQQCLVNILKLKLLFEFEHSLTGSVVPSSMFSIAVYGIVNDGQIMPYLG